MAVAVSAEAPDSDKVFHDTVFMEKNKHISDRWVRIAELYPDGISQPLLPAEFSREQFGQGNHYECFMLTALSTLVRFPSVIQNCFVSKHVRRDGRYTFQFFRGREWVKVEIDDQIPLEEDGELYIRSPTGHWWPLLLEKAYAKFYTGYENLEGCTLQETYHDLTGNPVLNIPIDAKLAKAAGADVTEGHYWLDLAQKIQSGQFVASVLTKDMETESMGIQREQQYGVLEIFSMTGTSSVNDIVIHLHNPFEDEEFIYTGPLNSKDSHWTPKLRAKYSVDDERSIFLPLSTFLKIINSMQLCYVSTIDGDATYFDDEWKGETAGGNPTCVTWRKNPLYSVRNTGKNPLRLVVMIKQEDQRRFIISVGKLQYLHCDAIFVQNTSANAIPTHNVTGNNHKPICKSLFLNSREVANAVTVPPNSLCYLVPSCMSKGSESKFTIALYHMVGEEYSSLTIKKLSVPEMDWDHPAEGHVELEQKQKDRVDFYVDQETDVHILLHQEKPYSSATGGDAMAQDYMGMYLYDDADRKIGGVHAATNFRETGIVYHLPRSGRYALSVTCPRAKGKVPALITIVASYSANSRLVEAPEDAGMFEDEDDDIDEGEESAARNNPIDYMPVNMPPSKITELPDSTTPFEDKRFMVDNKIITNDPWIHIGDLYPEGKTLPLLPDKLSRDQFEQGEHFECCCLTAFATLVDHHPDVLCNVFVTKEVRKDGRYTFQFHRYGQWVKVEIDDRIPLTKQQTLFCRSPTRHWWPLLLEKACAKFYTLYQNLEGCTLQELYYDFTGCPVMNIPTDLKLAKSAMYSVDDPEFWLDLNEDLKNCAYGATARSGIGSNLGIQEDQTYGILSVISTRNSVNPELSDLLVMIYNPFVEAVYTGPMNNEDIRWTPELRSMHSPEQRDTIYMPVGMFLETFSSIEKVLIRGVALPGWHFSSEWGEGTNGGNPTLVTWRENPLYVVRNNSEEPLQIMAMIGQPDQRHKLHLLPQQELDYIQCGLVLSQCTSSSHLATYLVTGNNHRIVHKGLFIDSRESANLVTVPPKSLCYLVPSAMFRDKSKFLLSYWYQKPADEKQMKLVRLNVDVARHLPAIEHLELRSREKDRVDFLVDVPTDIHILLQQEKPFRSSNGGDAMAEDFIGIYLYDGEDKRIQGVTSATNYREIGIVHHLPASGRYALCATCPRGNGVVPCKVEAVGVESAHVRITDPPDDARELGEVDLDFLDVEPESVPLDDLALHDDEAFKGLLAELKKLHKDPEGNADEISAVENQINDHAHILAKKILGKDRARYLPGRDLDLLNPILDSNVDYMDSERNRYGLKKDPRNATKVQFVEEVLQKKADAIAEKAKEPDILFLDPAPEGIPIQDMLLMGDSAFAASARERMKLKSNPVANASKISALEEEMDQRAHVLAKQLRAKERTFLDPEPEGVPLELLSLNENEAFQELERELRALNRKPRKDAKAIVALENDLLDRTNVLAKELKENERNIFLDPQPEGVPVSELSLDLDEPFHTMEVERLRLRHEDPRANVTKVKELENALNDRAQELAQVILRADRAFLDKNPQGVPLDILPLDTDPKFRKLEAERAKLKAQDPRRNGRLILDLENAMADRCHELAADQLREDLTGVDVLPRDIPLELLLPHSDPTFSALVDDLRALKKDPEENADAIETVLCAMNDRADDLAAAQLDRGFLNQAPAGVPLEILPLDSDAEFHSMETARVKLKLSDPRRNAKKIRDLEEEMNARAHELAKDQLAEDLAGVDAAPEGIPLSLLKLTEDGVFASMVPWLRELKKDPEANAEQIRNLEDKMNNRAYELADALLEGDRGYLDAAPEGVPLEELPLTNDDVFALMEVERAKLKAQDPKRNAARVAELELQLNEMAAKLARNVLAEDLKGFASQYEGVATEQLKPHNDREFASLVPELRRLKKEGPKNVLRNHMEEMDNRIREIAKEFLDGNLWFLDKVPEGVPLEYVPLAGDEKFEELRHERAALKADEPRKNADRIKECEDAMKKRSHELARDVRERDLDGIERKPYDIPLDCLPLREDPVASKLISRLREAKKGVASPAGKGAVSKLQDELGERARGLAWDALAGDRGKYLDNNLEGVSLSCLPLDTDPQFHGLEVERAQLKLADPRGNAKRIEDAEERLNDRARELARKQLEDDIAGLDLSSVDMPMDVLRPHRDAEFTDAAVRLRELKKDPRRNEKKIRDLEKGMSERVGELMREVLEGDRAFLDPDPDGVPLSDLPINEDQTFRAKEVKHAELKARDPVKHADAIAALENELNQRAHELALDQLKEDLRDLDDTPQGVPIALLRPHDDASFASSVPMLRRLKKDPTRNAEAIRALENKLEGYVDEMAHDFLRADRDSYLDPAPLGHPTATLPLDKDSEFKTLEARRLELMLDPRRNKEEVAELEEALNARATKLAEEMLRNDRAFLEREPEGVPLRYMHLDEHRQFHELEVKRAALKAKDPVRNAKAIKDIEDELNDLVHELARDQMAEDLRGVDPAPRGIPINLLRPLDDPKFNELVEELRALKASPTVNPNRLHALEAEMNNRAGELAERARLGCRDKLDPYPEGLPLEKLPLDEDETFSQIELEMAGLKLADPARNAARVANLAEKLNDRALDIARAVKKKDLEGLEEAPRGIPLVLLRPHNDEVFASLANEARGDGSRSRSLLSPAAADALNERARELADQLLQGDRGFLERDPEGIPLSVLPLDTDPVFREVEVERAVLKLSDPRKNADRIASLESRLNDRAHELAQERLSGDRGYLDVELAGVSSADLPLDEDPKFHQMEVERAKLKERDPVSNAYRIRDLEEKLNVRAQELAQRVLEEDLKGIDTEPEDVPLVLLHPHKDPEFASFLPDLRRLKKNSGRNAAPISAVQNKMNDRVHELAREMITEGRNSLDPEPEGVPLGYLPLGTDKQFGELEKKLYALQAAPRRNDGAIANLRERLNDRAHELAKEKIQGDRGFLEPEPEGIPLSDLPLDSDEKFHKMETERAKLKENPAKNADAIARMEKDLNDRVHEMAKELKEEVRAFLNTTSYGISKELLPLDKDRNFQGMEQQLRKLGRNPRQNAAAIESLREMLQDRADELGLQMLRGDRPNYLEPEYEGVEPVDVPVDDDKVFAELELERAIVKAKDPQSISDKIEELEGKLRDRFHELAKERIRRDRLFLDSEPEGIPLESVPLNDDADFRRLEGQLRKLSRDMRRNGPDISDTRDRLNDRAHELARGVVADDMRCLKDTYRGIPKEDLNLHKDAKFRDLANGRRRAARSRGALPAELTAIEGAMDARACEIADNCINYGRAFLDREPEGMDLADVPLDNDGRFAAMEAERRKRTKDPRSSRRNKDMIRDLEDDMIARSHALALEEFAKMRGFMDQEPEGVPLKEIPLDVDPEFRQAEVARYRMRKDPHHSPEEVAKLEDAMNDRARRLAKAILAKNRGFLDPEPCGVPLAELPLNTDEEFNKLAAERYRLKRSNKKDNNPEVKGIENEMNDRVHALAREHLRKARAFLNPEPEGVPLEDVPLGRDPRFLDMERGLAKLRNDPNASAETLSSLEEDLNLRAHEVAREFLKKERAYLDPEPLGVLVEDLPLNHDPILNALERKRRELKKDPKRNGDSIRGCEDDIHDRVRAIAKEFLDNERRFLDPEPEGVLLRYLPLNLDKKFRLLELKRREKLRLPFLKNEDHSLRRLERKMNDRAHTLAKEILARNHAFLDPEPLGVPLDDLPLNTDEKFRRIDEVLCIHAMDTHMDQSTWKELQNELNGRAFELASELLNEERSFLPLSPFGIPLEELSLNNDLPLRTIERARRAKRWQMLDDAEEKQMIFERVLKIADGVLANDREYLQPNPWKVSLTQLPLDRDDVFHSLELERRRLKKNPAANRDEIRKIENALNDRELRLAEEFIQNERAFLEREPEGVPLELLPLDLDNTFHEMELERRQLRQNPKISEEAIEEYEEKMRDRVRALALEYRGWQDEEFHESNKHMAEEWPRICELYPEGIRDPVVPEKTLPSQVSSAPLELGYLAPFIAAMSRHPPLIDRLFDSKEHPVNGPYSFIFYDPNSNPVRVEIDDRVPVDANMEPKFTRVPKRSWYPLLLEKAYAKFVGGYSRLDQCTPHETLRDLTGCPVLHIPLDDKLAEAANTGDFRSAQFWREIHSDLAKGDVITCMSNVDAGDGIHPLCSYALFAVIETVKESNDPADIVIKLHNCYFDEPFYSGPLNRNDGFWKKELRDVCGSDPSRVDHLFIPLLTFLNNFSSMQRCNVNCGDRLTSAGKWNRMTCGGNPKFTTFRNNPIYLVENKSSRPVRILAELRHQTPSFSDSDGLNHYHQTGLVLMQSVHAKMAPTPLITSSTHRFIQKGMMLDAREVCSQMELPPSTTCYLIPYTMKRGCHGKFNISVYPGMAKVTLTPLRYAGLKREPLVVDFVLKSGLNSSSRVSLQVSDPCDVHVLLGQVKRRGNVNPLVDFLADDAVKLTVFDNYGIKLASTGDATNAREQALVLQLSKNCLLNFVAERVNRKGGGDCPCSLYFFTPPKILAKIVSLPPLNPVAAKPGVAVGGWTPRGVSTSSCESADFQN
ncbi:calpain-like cysteine peptidase, putative [Trypanosoma cruzi]|uniref:Calpain-like cysteine peptidase, putative n=1 Tax=Trypanosoma cruzi (strain CL Brener) TaxID=353153 RepID=Q4D6J0_TRYCC|nr:calpain-like cysteine peptidase, putative [Trypanosoma cruzi]EAN88142.1 calpain-like cysteine peptidase, putative [Trypanosoma cruzi]|eukprot:XP_809993.1 calpain-like cysteine peptidase [Trypanosoma cruzi strain CL Brener]